MGTVPPTLSPDADEAAALSHEERTWGMLSHMLTMLGYLGGIAHFVPPLVVWLVKKNDSEFVADQAKEALNFQLTVLLATLVGIAMVLSVVLSCFGIAYLLLVQLGQVVFTIAGALSAQEGKRFRYPFAIPFVT